MRQMTINENDYNMLILKLNHASCVSELLITDSECHSWGGNTLVQTQDLSLINIFYLNKPS